MARTDTLTNYLTDIADAIREKTGSSEPIQASSFDTAIENIPSGGGDIDWSEIGYSSTPQEIINAFNYAKDIYDNWDSSITNRKNAFSGDLNMVFMPLVDTSNVVTMEGMFSYSGIFSVPLLDTSNVTSMHNMFTSCASLATIPQLNTNKVTDMEYMFGYCSKLKTAPMLDTSNVTNMRSMFYECRQLTNVPVYNTSKATDMSNIFSYCSFTTAPMLDTSSAVEMPNVFSYNTNLQNVPLLDAGKARNISGILNNCRNLENLGGFANLGMNYELRRSENYSWYTLDLSVCTKLTHESLMNVINNLYDIKTKGCKNQKLQLGSTNLAKLTAEEIAIATNKGWNVV